MCPTLQPQHTQTSENMCLYTSCNLHFFMFSGWLLLHTCWMGKYVPGLQSSVMFLWQCVYFGRQVFRLQSRCWGGHRRDTLVLFSVTPLKQFDPSSVGLPVVVQIIDGCLMETSLTAMQHEHNHRGALSQHLCVFIFFSSCTLPTPGVMTTKVEYPREILYLKCGFFSYGSL